MAKNIDLDAISSFFTKTLARHGETPKGVDWNGEESQLLRFEQISKIITGDSPFTLNDFGCGYGAYFEFLERRYPSFAYTGIDIAAPMITAAAARLADRSNATFVCGAAPKTRADYCVASGVFNMKLNHSPGEWQEYVESMLEAMSAACERGFSFNCLTGYSDPEKMRADLYYADPCYFFDLCKKKYSRNVALLHDYDLYEFTILVRK